MKNTMYYSIIIFVILIGFNAFKSNTNVTPNIYPIQEKSIQVSSGYGMRVHPITHESKMHTGVDFRAELGTPVLATADGKVIAVEFFPEGYGKKITIKHANNIKTVYAQLETVLVEVGQRVSQKDRIGTVGSSGKSSGPHLHYEIELNNLFVDPFMFINN